MKNYSLIIFTLIFAISCKSDKFTHQHSLTISNNSDYEIIVRLYQKEFGNHFPISKDSFSLEPQSEETFYEAEYDHNSWEGVLCGLLDIDSSKFIIENGLQLKKDINDYSNWIDETDV